MFHLRVDGNSTRESAGSREASYRKTFDSHGEIRDSSVALINRVPVRNANRKIPVWDCEIDLADLSFSCSLRMDLSHIYSV